MTKRMIYVGCGDEREIGIFELMEPGIVEARGVAEVPGATGPSSSLPLAVSADRRFLFAAVRQSPHPIATYAIHPQSGALDLLGLGRLPTSMCAIAADRAGRWLFSASYDGAIVAANPIGADGVVGETPARVVETPPKAHNVLVEPGNRFLYAATLGGDAVLCWPIDTATGLPAGGMRTTRVPEGAGPRHLTLGPDGSRLYAINELDGTVAVFDRDAASGELTLRQSVPTLEAPAAGKAAAADIHLTPDGRFLFASVRRDSFIAAFAVDPGDGTLSLRGRFPVEKTPRAFAIASDGRHLICAGRDDAAFGVYAINPSTGALTRLARHATSPNPNWVEIVDLG